MNLLILAAAILPGLLICYYIYRKDKYDKEPRRLLVQSFLFGMLSAVPAVVGQLLFKQFFKADTFYGELLFAFAVVAVTEEGSKFFFLRAFAYPKVAFNEPMDGIVYAVMIGMGFATLENVLYSLESGLATAVGRALTAVPAHAAFAVLMGAFVGASKFDPVNRQRLQWAGLGLAVGFHGAYDFCLMQERYQGLMFMVVPILIIAVSISRRLIRNAVAASPFNDQPA